MRSVPRVPMYVSPERGEALRQLDILLEDYDYSPTARAEVLEYVAREGTPSGCPSLDPEDEADAEMVYVGSLGDVPYDSPAWHRDRGVTFDAALLAKGIHPWPVPVTPGPDDRSVPPDADLVPPEALDLADMGLAPIAGGADPFEPTEQDWADYREWAEECDRRQREQRMDRPEPPRYGYE